MIKHIWSVLCRRSITDKETNNISILNVFEQLEVNATIKKDEKKKLEQVNIPIEYEIVSMWFRENSNEKIKADVEIVVINPNGKTEKTFLQKFEMPPGMRRMRSKIRIFGLTINNSGDYIFRIRIKEANQKEYQDVTNLPLEVKIKKTFNSKTN